MKVVIEKRTGIWFDIIVGGIRIKQCRLHRGPAGLPDLRLPHGVEFASELFASARRTAAMIMGDQVSG